MHSARFGSCAFCRSLGFELSRFVTPFRMAVAAASLISMVVLARDNLVQQLAIASSQTAVGAGVSHVVPSALDMAYLAFNNKLIAGLILPAACGMLGADSIVRDCGGMRTLIGCEIRSSSTYVAAKLVTVAIVCHLFVLGFVVACALVSCLLLGLPVLAEPPAWLASAGPQDSMWGQYGPIPAEWNYVALMFALVVGFGVLETVLSWAAMAACSILESPGAASLCVASAYVIAVQLESLITSLGLLLGIESMTTTTGWVVDRLCLANYRLGASFFQEVAGGAYRGPLAVPSDVATGTYPINSWASLLLMIFALAAVSITWLVICEGRRGART